MKYLGISQELEVLSVSHLYHCLEPQNQKLTMSLRSDFIRVSVLGFRSDVRIEFQAPVAIFSHL